MPLNWNEIKERATAFAKEWANTTREEADAKPFLVAFFNVFGISSRRVATFEHRVKKLDDSDGYIDLLWKGMMLVEMKSKGKNLDRAYEQATAYLHGLKEHELPKLILVADFDLFRLYDLEENTLTAFSLDKLPQYVHHFGFLLGYQKKVYQEQDPANLKAAELMGKLHDRLEYIGYSGHPLEVYLVRLLFCLFAEDTTIFEKQQFQDYIELLTNADGSDLAPKLQQLFQVLNTPLDKRFKNLDPALNDFPYVNGKLFEEILPTASFDTKMRLALLECAYLDWSKISPAIFGAMFQSVMNPTERRNLGAHYTSETNILKLIKPLFLDDLWRELEAAKDNTTKLKQLHLKISQLRFLDPACGCGNFLIITYRELRLLENAILRHIYKGQQVFNIKEMALLDVDMMFGIEYEEFPARIAEVAMWLIDHQMNMRLSYEFGQYFIRLPLQKAANIVHGNALTLDWQAIVPPERLAFIIGNPPFVGSKLMSQTQRDQITALFRNAQGSGVLDYVTGWYAKAAQYIQHTNIKVAFVSTNSIVQGEQVSILWGELLHHYQLIIHFAHRTFKWSNEAKGNAAVYCVIVGFANFDTPNKRIFEYQDIKGEPHEIKAKNINPYLIDAKNIIIQKRNSPICKVPEMNFGNMPLDGGNFLFSDEEKSEFIKIQPESEKYFKPLISAYEFLNNKKRWCLWLVNANPAELKKMPEVLKRVEAVKKFRLNSVAPSTQKHADFPTLFRDRNNPSSFIVIPSTSSENRKYIPIGFFDKNSIASNSCHIIPDGTIYHFGILTSEMQMAWVKHTCGRLKSDFRYSNSIVYNNYPFPESPSERQIGAIEEAAKQVLAVREQFAGSSLADLYDPLTMPPALLKAHQKLDKAVDVAYRPQPFASEAKRMEFLFELYEKYTANLFTTEKPKRKKK